MSLNRLLFDPANAADSANVGSWMLAGTDGAQIGHISDSLKVTITSHLAAGTDSVAAWTFDGIGTAITSTLVSGKQGLDVNLITATVAVTQSGTWTTGRTWTLGHATDSVSSWAFDGAGTALTSTLVSGKQALDVNVVDPDGALADVSLTATANSVTTTEAALGGTVSGRKYVSLYNNGSKIIYIGATGVTTATGFPIPPGSILEARIGDAVAIHAITASGTQDLRELQLA